MANVERSDALRHKWIEASAKFDYFVLGAVLALVGYLAGSLSLSPLSFLDSNTVEVGALVLLLGSAVCGFLRIETALKAIKANANFVFFGELAQGTAAERSLLEDNDFELLLDRTSNHWKSSKRWYNARNILLIAGLAGIIVARVMEAYGV